MRRWYIEEIRENRKDKVDNSITNLGININSNHMIGQTINNSENKISGGPMKEDMIKK
jgi:hypothetical protein